MSENKCLVTKLGASVSGNFPKLGELIIPISSEGLTIGSSDTMFFYYEGAVSSNLDYDYAKLRGNIHYQETGASENNQNGAIGSSRAKKLVSGEAGELVIANKYKLTQLNFNTDNVALFSTEVDVQDFAYNAGLTALSLPVKVTNPNYKVKGDIAALTGKPLTTLNLQANAHLEGDVVALAYMFYKATKGGSNITCNLRDCGVEGSVEGLVTAIRALQAADSQEQTSSTRSHKANFTGSNITFNGSTMSSVSGNSIVLAWTADTITYNGVTINA